VPTYLGAVHNLSVLGGAQERAIRWGRTPLSVAQKNFLVPPPPNGTPCEIKKKGIEKEERISLDLKGVRGSGRKKSLTEKRGNFLIKISDQEGRGKKRKEVYYEHSRETIHVAKSEGLVEMSAKWDLGGVLSWVGGGGEGVGEAVWAQKRVQPTLHVGGVVYVGPLGSKKKKKRRRLMLMCFTPNPVLVGVFWGVAILTAVEDGAGRTALTRDDGEKKRGNT